MNKSTASRVHSKTTGEQVNAGGIVVHGENFNI